MNDHHYFKCAGTYHQATFSDTPRDYTEYDLEPALQDMITRIIADEGGVKCRCAKCHTVYYRPAVERGQVHKQPQDLCIECCGIIKARRENNYRHVKASNKRRAEAKCL